MLFAGTKKVPQGKQASNSTDAPLSNSSLSDAQNDQPKNANNQEENPPSPQKSEAKTIVTETPSSPPSTTAPPNSSTNPPKKEATQKPASEKSENREGQNSTDVSDSQNEIPEKNTSPIEKNEEKQKADVSSSSSSEKGSETGQHNSTETDQNNENQTPKKQTPTQDVVEKVSNNTEDSIKNKTSGTDAETKKKGKKSEMDEHHCWWRNSAKLATFIVAITFLVFAITYGCARRNGYCRCSGYEDLTQKRLMTNEYQPNINGYKNDSYEPL